MVDLDDVYRMAERTHDKVDSMKDDVADIKTQVAVNQVEIKTVGINLNRHETDPAAHRKDGRKDAAVVLTSKQITAIIGVLAAAMVILQAIVTGVLNGF